MQSLAGEYDKMDADEHDTVNVVLLEPDEVARTLSAVTNLRVMGESAQAPVEQDACSRHKSYT